MIPIWIAVIIAFVSSWVGFFLCALLTIGRDAPQPVDNIRGVFETWITDYFEGGVDLCRTFNDDYADFQTHDMWQAFNAGDRHPQKMQDEANAAVKAHMRDMEEQDG